MVLNNQVNFHRLRFCFVPEIKTDYVKAQIPDGYVKTKNEKINHNWQNEFVENKLICITLISQIV